MRADPDLAAGQGCVNRIGDQLAEYLQHPFAIGFDLDARQTRLDDQPNALAARVGRRSLDGLRNNIGNVDRSAIEQVLLNLISNANKYGDRSKPVVIDVGPDGNEVRVSVTNAGSQLDHDSFAHVFEPFFRMPASAATAPGIGLGLTVCHRLIAAQGGHMSAEAVDGGGARFTFRLPKATGDEDDV